MNFSVTFGRVFHEVASRVYYTFERDDGRSTTIRDDIDEFVREICGSALTEPQQSNFPKAKMETTMAWRQTRR